MSCRCRPRPGRGLDHRPTRDRRATSPGPVSASPRRAGFGIRAHRWDGRALERRLRALRFATMARGLTRDEAEIPLRMLNDGRIDGLYEAVIDGVESI